MKLDRTDKAIIDHLQSDGRASVEKVAEAVGLSPTPVRRRIRRLEDEGVIRSYAAVVDPERCGLGLTLYVAIRLERRSRKAITAFERAIRALPEIMRCDLVSGAFDYLLMLHLESMEDYNHYLHVVLADVPGIAGIETSIVIGNVKQTHALALR